MFCAVPGRGGSRGGPISSSHPLHWLGNFHGEPPVRCQGRPAPPCVKNSIFRPSDGGAGHGDVAELCSDTFPSLGGGSATPLDGSHRCPKAFPVLAIKIYQARPKTWPAPVALHPAVKLWSGTFPPASLKIPDPFSSPLGPGFPLREFYGLSKLHPPPCVGVWGPTWLAQHPGCRNKKKKPCTLPPGSLVTP